MATTAVKEAMASRIQAENPRKVTRNPTAVLHGTVPDKATRGIQYLAAKLAIVQDAKAAKKTRHSKTAEVEKSRKNHTAVDRALIIWRVLRQDSAPSSSTRGTAYSDNPIMADRGGGEAEYDGAASGD